MRGSLCLLLLSCTREFSLPPSSPALAVSPPVAQVSPLGAAEFAVSGGARPYAAALTAQSSEEAPGAAATATLDGETLRYQAGSRGNVQDSIALTDAQGHSI